MTKIDIYYFSIPPRFELYIDHDLALEGAVFQPSDLMRILVERKVFLEEVEFSENIVV